MRSKGKSRAFHVDITLCLGQAMLSGSHQAALLHHPRLLKQWGVPVYALQEKVKPHRRKRGFYFNFRALAEEEREVVCEHLRCGSASHVCKMKSQSCTVTLEEEAQDPVEQHPGLIFVQTEVLPLRESKKYQVIEEKEPSARIRKTYG